MQFVSNGNGRATHLYLLIRAAQLNQKRCLKPKQATLPKYMRWKNASEKTKTAASILLGLFEKDPSEERG
eukprot:1143763-Pelagomonas_calceolata.AAC.3